ncbi:peptidoglycan editing factor PgeF [Parabacteroides sp. PFB2-10]|uniref:peptidoglycan editing factor PgeF n=1 Tax=Parabacteroides sp. PFB2-10 TaxID=1742405 RepID=UPI002473241A|nr:peptidoglycan editing factor PgeF [Parabacteroides sp. PFB2-10]MDL2244745.1 peptidoglycan editing factor PgeF [Parabacteroides sp. OttesenSCG-928-J18]
MTKSNQPKHTIEMLQFDLLKEDCNISHFVTTRQGGVGRGVYASLNLGYYCGDKQEVVDENRIRLCDQLGISTASLIVPQQTHGLEALTVDRTFLSLPPEEQQRRLYGIDALITGEKQVCLAVTTADCVPILLYAPDRGMVAAIHAGWKGTAGRIVERTVGLLKDRFDCDSASMIACIGPSISPEAFEVGEEVADVYRAEGDEELVYYFDGDRKPHIDLWQANRKQLLLQGLQEERIEVSGECTYRQPELFFSARRDGVKSGRMLTGIMIKK